VRAAGTPAQVVALIIFGLETLQWNEPAQAVFGTRKQKRKFYVTYR
jgi:hypothetical protein